MGLSSNFPCERHSCSGRNPPGGAGDLVPAATCVGLGSDPCILASGSRGGNPSDSDGSGRWVDQFWHPRSASRHDPRKIAAKPWETLDLLLRLSPLLLVFVTVFFSWPLVLIPPGARTEELRGDARWFEQHPFVGLALIGVVIVVSIAASCASHR